MKAQILSFTWASKESTPAVECGKILVFRTDLCLPAFTFREATLRKLMLVVHDDRDAAVLKGWRSLSCSPEARSRLHFVKTLVICDPFVSAGSATALPLSAFSLS